MSSYSPLAGEHPRVALLETFGSGLIQLLEESGFQIATPGGNADAAILRSGTHLDRARLEGLVRRGLRVVVRAGTGLDNIDTVACEALGVAVHSLPGMSARSVAEVALSFGLALLHHLGLGHHGMRAGRFEKAALVGLDLASCDVGIVGFGATGRAVARLLRLVGVGSVRGWSRSARPGQIIDGVAMASLPAVLGQKLVFLHLPLAAETHHLIGHATTSALSPGVLLVNMSRREVVDHAVLSQLLDSGIVGAYASDVLDPIADLDLIRRGNVIATPHLGAQTRSTQHKIALAVRDTLQSHFKLIPISTHDHLQ